MITGSSMPTQSLTMRYRLQQEWRLFSRQRLPRLALLLLAVLTAVALWNGAMLSDRQLQLSQQRAALEQASNATFLAHMNEQTEAGGVGYYYFHVVDNPPSNVAFLAFGQRDLQPVLSRVRLLGLDAQLYESEQRHPEFQMIGVFDFAFVLIYLSPLVVLLLMHDLQSSEREAGRLGSLRLLLSDARLWLPRIALRLMPLAAALFLPLAVACWWRQVSLTVFILIVLIGLLYLVFWFSLAWWLTSARISSASNAARLLAAWLTLTLLAPAAAQLIIHQALPVSQGMSLTLKQRDAVHQAWDLPKSVTFDRFFVAHPEWKDTPPVTGRFHWKWYYAFQHVGDMQVAADVQAYREQLSRREQWSKTVGHVLPAVAVQHLLHRLADTDLQQQLDWQLQVRHFHDRLRHYFYPFLFNERAFDQTALAEMPRWQAEVRAGDLSVSVLAAFLLLTIACCYLAFVRRELAVRPTMALPQPQLSST